MDSPKEVGDNAPQRESFEEMCSKLVDDIELRSFANFINQVDDIEVIRSFTMATLRCQFHRRSIAKDELDAVTERLNEANRTKDSLVKQLRKFDTVKFLRRRIDSVQCSECDFKRSTFVKFMKKKYKENNPQELAIQSHPYCLFQYLIHMALENSNDLIKLLRQKYGSDRNLAHKFCKDIEAVYNLLGEDVDEEMLLDRKYKLHEIIEDLEELQLSPDLIDSVKTFLEFDGIEP